MKSPSAHADVIIIGAGLAGLAAANLCAAEGLKVIILEAKDRVGGRVWTREFAETGTAVDWGAEWIIPSMHHEVMTVVKAADLTLERPAANATVQWKLPGQSMTGTYHQLKQQHPAFAAALVKIEVHARQHSATKMAITANLSLSAYFDQITQNADMQELLNAAVFPLTGAAPETVAAEMLWHEIACHGQSIDDTLSADACRIAEGCGTLASRLLEPLQQMVFTNCQVTAIAHTVEGVQITSTNHHLTARHCILAVPLRTLSAIHFEPPLPEALWQSAEHSNAGRVAKVWALANADTLADEVLDTASILRYGYARSLGQERWLLCGQLLSASDAPLSEAVIRSALQQAWPQATITSCEVVDWPHDPAARASWHSTRAGWAGTTEAFRKPFGAIHFAGGDIASRWAGWMEGALLSGAEAARAVIAKSG